MADVTLFKMFYFLFLLILVVINESRSTTITIRKEKSCGCYEECAKNFTSNSIKDVQNLASCQRGCRFYSLVFHMSHERNSAKGSNHAKEGCRLSCHDSYKHPFKISSCKYGCSAGESTKTTCTPVEQAAKPQISYSFLFDEPEGLIHPGEPDPEDVLMDPGLRKQFDRTMESLFEQKTRLPEIHFRNLPVQSEKSSPDYSHLNLKCSKFYGFDSKFEFRNGKIIIGDLYLFVGVFAFVVICFILGHHIEARSMSKQVTEAKMAKARQEFTDRLPLLPPEFYDHSSLLAEKDPPPEYTLQKLEAEEALESVVVEKEDKFEDVTLAFSDDEGPRSSPVASPQGSTAFSPPPPRSPLPSKASDDPHLNV